MLHKIVLAKTRMIAIGDVASPILQLSVALILMTDPISLALERLRFLTVREGTGERLDIFVHMFGPVRRFVEFLHLETQGTFELCWQTFDGWERNT